MQRLILLRHGKTESISSSGGDHDRVLTDRGHRDAALMGRLLAEAGLSPDLVLVSDAKRTQETWEDMSPAFPQAEVDIDRTLYLASAERLSHLVDANRDAAACLMIIGHNPGLHELAAIFAGRSHGPAFELLMQTFPTGAAAVFSSDADGGWTLEHMLTPKDNGGGVF